MRAGERGLAGVIVGRAIYEGRFGVADALASLAETMAD
jgi:phosphoribosylformimino-5-aminoimidazole carboxamide ribonucleotide (ProFAR) isomerase